MSEKRGKKTERERCRLETVRQSLGRTQSNREPNNEWECVNMNIQTFKDFNKEI